MSKTATLTIRVDQDTKDRLEAAAKTQKRSKAFLVGEAIKERDYPLDVRTTNTHIVGIGGFYDKNVHGFRLL